MPRASSVHKVQGEPSWKGDWQTQTVKTPSPLLDSEPLFRDTCSDDRGDETERQFEQACEEAANKAEAVLNQLRRKKQRSRAEESVCNSPNAAPRGGLRKVDERSAPAVEAMRELQLQWHRAATNQRRRRVPLRAPRSTDTKNIKSALTLCDHTAGLPSELEKPQLRLPALPCKLRPQQRQVRLTALSETTGDARVAMQSAPRRPHSQMSSPQSIHLFLEAVERSPEEKSRVMNDMPRSSAAALIAIETEADAAAEAAWAAHLRNRGESGLK
eukprot:SAG31_NODE_6933_length_1843_cov_1.113402_1_plen_272_part_00